MRSGLAVNDPHYLSLDGDDLAAEIATQLPPLKHPPGQVFEYCAVNTILLCRMIRQTVGDGERGLDAFLQRELFEPLHIRTRAIFDGFRMGYDASGTFLGAIALWTTPRVLASIGLLYLRGGMFNGRRILPEWWVDTARAFTFNDGGTSGYALLWWKDPRHPSWFEARGLGGQRLLICPEEDVIVIRLGRGGDHDPFFRPFQDQYLVPLVPLATSSALGLSPIDQGMHLPSVALGSSGLVTSAIGFGAMELTAYYGPALPDDEAFEVLRTVMRHGCSHFDTAEVYVEVPPGATAANVTADPNINAKRNEALLGAFFRRSRLPRASFTVATKFAPGLHGPIGELDSYGTTAVGTMLNASLERLGLAYVDLLYLHRMPHTFELLATWLRAAQAMVVQGKARFLGLSEVSATWLRRAHAIVPISVIQQEWSLTVRGPEAELVPTCVELGIGIVAYAPLSRSLLLRSGVSPPRDYRGSQEPRFTGVRWQVNQRVAAHLSAFADQRGVSPARVMLAWLYRRAQQLGVKVLPIPGTTNRFHAAENIEAASSPLSLSMADMEALNAIGASVVGARARDDYLEVASDADYMKS